MKIRQNVQRSQDAVINKMMPYLILSGKSIDDLGFPTSCQKDNIRFKYSTVQVTVDTDNTQYVGYYGFCFTGICSIEELNEYGKFIIEFVFKQSDQYQVKCKFVNPPLELEYSGAALGITLGFLGLLAFAMIAPIKRWIQICREGNEVVQFDTKPVYIDLQHPEVQYDDQRITEESTIMQRFSFKYKWKQLWKEEESYKIIEFSIFRVLAIPLLMYGQIFWLTNFGAYNYYAFYEEIYDQFYIKFAIFAYYLPDIFFFISAYLVTKKIISCKDKIYSNLGKVVGLRVLRLYPLYLVAWVIYWGISPSLHAGPVWYVYQEEAEICSTAWWRVLLLIDNWFSQGCYPVLWFVQLQIQYLLVSTLLFFIIYLKKPRLGFILLAVYLLTTFICLFIFSAEMLVSVKIAIDPYTQLYFKSFHSHIWFYLVGVLFGLITEKEEVRGSIQEVLVRRPRMSTVLRILPIGLLVLIILRPWVWWGHKSLQIELSACRYGTFLSFVVMFHRGLFVRDKNRTVLHKYGYYMYPVILVSYMVSLSSFWSVGSFMYVSGTNVLNQMVPNFIISYVLGIFLGLFFDTRTFVIK